MQTSKCFISSLKRKMARRTLLLELLAYFQLFRLQVEFQLPETGFMQKLSRGGEVPCASAT